MYQTDFLLHYLHHYNLSEIGMLTPIQRMMEISLLMKRLEEEKLNNNK